MKKLYLSLLFMITVVILAACQPNQSLPKAKSQEINRESNGIVLEVEKDQFHTPEEKEINVIIKNTSNQQFTYGTYFKIEQNIDSIWYEIPFKNGVGFDDIGLTLKPYESKKESYSLDLFEEALSPGIYRVIISFIDSSKPYSKENKITLAVPFELTKK